MSAQSSGVKNDQFDPTSIWGAIIFPKISAFWKKGFGCDVTIICKDGSVNAPSVLLASLSDKLYQLIVTSPDNNITFFNISVKFWEVLLDLAYSGQLKDDMVYDLSSDFYISLIVQHALQMTDILALYKRLFGVEGKRNKIEDFPETLLFEEESDIEYSNDNQSKLSTTLTTEIEMKVKEYFEIPQHKIQYRNRTSMQFQGHCEICDVDCTAPEVQCLICGKKVAKRNGYTHMVECHRYSPCEVWPYSCFCDQVTDINHLLKGCRTPKNQQNRPGPNCVFNCKVCNYTTDKETSFNDHFIMHGFFPEVCGFCGDVFSESHIKSYHVKYCQSSIRIKSEIKSNIFGDLEFEMSELQNDDNCVEEDDGTGIEGTDEDKQLIALPIDENDCKNMDEGLESVLAECMSNVSQTSSFQGKCIVCLSRCTAETVICLYCGDVVPNDAIHMVSAHSECSGAREWMYSCFMPREKRKASLKASEIVVKKSSFHDEIDGLKCMLCDVIYKDTTMMLLHARASHAITNVYYCQHCKAGFRTAKIQASHEQFCGGGNYLQCKRCNVYFTNVEQHEEHVQKLNGCLTESELLLDGPVAQDEFDEDSPEMSPFEEDNLEDSEEEEDLSQFQPLACYKCGTNCSAERVECFYCRRIVNKDLKHMEEYHPFIPKTSLWLYTCDIKSNSEEDADSVPSWLLFIKKPKIKNNKNCYECQKCSHEFSVLKKIVAHSRRKHKIPHIKVCDVCGYGFGSEVYHQDHQHFCSGGSLIHCDICDQVVGTYEALLIHNIKCIRNQQQLNGTDPHQLKVIKKDDLDATSARQDQSAKKQNLPWQPVCYFCDGIDCKATKVKCIYCMNVVEKSSDHMQTCHPFTPQTSLWAYTCKYHKKTTMQGSKFIVSVKERNPVVQNRVYKHSMFDDEESQGNDKVWSDFQYRCKKCNGVFEKLADVEHHLKTNYQISAKFCLICEMGFEQIGHMKNHQYYCRGGKLLHCVICKKQVGSYKAYFDHVFKYHQEQSKSIQVYQGLELTSVVSMNKPKRAKSSEESNLMEIIKTEEFDTEPHESQTDKGTVSEKVITIITPAKVGQIKGEKVTAKQLKSHENVPNSGKEIYVEIIQGDTQHNIEFIGTDAQLDTEKNTPRKLILKVNAELDVKEFSQQLRDAVGSDIQELFTEEKTSQIGVSNPKRCFTCGDNCNAQKVKCMYCCKVLSGNVDSHMQACHPAMVENNVIWAVNCSYFKEDEISPILTEVYVVESSDSPSKVEMQHCLICNAMFTKKEKLCCHIAESHDINKMFFCNVCNAGFRFASKRLSHEEFCSGGDLLKCVICEKVVGSWIMAQSHYSAFHQQKTEKAKGILKAVFEKGKVKEETKMKKIDENEKMEAMEQGQNGSIKIPQNDDLNTSVEEEFDEIEQRDGTSNHTSKCANKSQTKTLSGKKSTKRLKMHTDVNSRTEHGYEIYCAICESTTCTASSVKCGLCSEKVEARDIHMKLKHPYTPSTKWVVYCKFTRTQGKTRSFIIGERVSAAPLRALKEENAIPSELPCYYRCNQCIKVFSEKYMLERHITFAHIPQKDIPLYQCDACDAMTLSLNLAADHKQFCKYGTIHSCQMCNEPFRCNRELVRHKTQTHADELNKKKGLIVPKGTLLKCAEADCEFETYEYQELRTHNKTIHGYLNYQLYQLCRYCYKVFRSEREREIHQQQEHLNGQRCLCETCGKDCETPTQLNRHIQYHHKGERERSSIMQKYHRPRKMCPICGYTATTVSAYKQHIRIKHDKHFYNCELCPQRFNSNSMLKKHMNRAHTGGKTHSCPYCPYMAYDGSRINDHAKKMHPGKEAPFKIRRVIHKYVNDPHGEHAPEEQEQNYLDDNSQINNSLSAPMDIGEESKVVANQAKENMMMGEVVMSYEVEVVPDSQITYTYD